MIPVGAALTVLTLTVLALTADGRSWPDRITQWLER